MSSVPNRAKSAANWTKENPGTAACAVVGAGGLAVVAAPALVTAPFLSAAGFGANGIVGGTAASAIQASIGNVAAQSLFAVCQSAAMGGYGAATVAVVGQGAGAATAAAGGGAAAWKFWKGKGKKPEGGQDEKNEKEGRDESGEMGHDGEDGQDFEEDGDAVVVEDLKEPSDCDIPRKVVRSML